MAWRSQPYRIADLAGKVSPYLIYCASSAATIGSTGEATCSGPGTVTITASAPENLQITVNNGVQNTSNTVTGTASLTCQLESSLSSLGDAVTVWSCNLRASGLTPANLHGAVWRFLSDKVSDTVSSMSSPLLPFEFWRQCLREDSVRQLRMAPCVLRPMSWRSFRGRRRLHVSHSAAASASNPQYWVVPHSRCGGVHLPCCLGL